ncbi:hypothetical protein NDU88_007683 [Pleurodeles waltl]|uniref:Uncharacterized protein n=1 Tax=Pleurodeles waltl TaxID=8319 RepID=A0AAV7PM08_PLEWA|nr:hypothetical protein NDU88_007683 [Pleurodeles waltl]
MRSCASPRGTHGIIDYSASHRCAPSRMLSCYMKRPGRNVPSRSIRLWSPPPLAEIEAAAQRATLRHTWLCFLGGRYSRGTS